MKKPHLLVAAVSLALAAGNASADFINTVSNPAGTVQSSSVIFTAVDENSASANYGATFVYDLALGDSGLNFSSFTQGTQGANGVLNWNLAGVSAFSAFAADNSKLQWTVQAGQALVGGLTSTAPNLNTWGAATTETGGPSAFSSQVSGADAVVNSIGGAGTIAGWIQAVNTYQDNNGITTNVDAIPSGGIATEANLASVFTSSGSIFANEGGINSNSIAFYDVTNTNTSTRAGRTSPNVVTNLGTFSLSGNELTYTATGAVSAVPLPAATWLFLSGILGLLGLNRHNRQAGISA